MIANSRVVLDACVLANFGLLPARACHLLQLTWPKRLDGTCRRVGKPQPAIRGLNDVPRTRSPSPTPGRMQYGGTAECKSSATHRYNNPPKTASPASAGVLDANTGSTDVSERMTAGWVFP